MIFAPVFLLMSVALVAWLVVQWPVRAGDGVSTAARGFAVLTMLLAALLLLAVSVWMTAWTARGGDWDWGPTHMGRMMRWERTTPGTTLSTDDASVAVQIRDFDYAPRTLTVRRGARVTWTNEDAVPHSATDAAKRWDTGVLNKNASAEKTFDTAGSFPYFCTVHPSMTGSVTVRP